MTTAVDATQVVVLTHAVRIVNLIALTLTGQGAVAYQSIRTQAGAVSRPLGVMTL